MKKHFSLFIHSIYAPFLLVHIKKKDHDTHITTFMFVLQSMCFLGSAFNLASLGLLSKCVDTQCVVSWGKEFTIAITCIYDATEKKKISN